MSAATKERSICLKTWEPPAFQSGRKTQIRRPINGLKFNPTWIGWDEGDDGRYDWYARDVDSGNFEPAECWNEQRLQCPFGRAGDALIGKEAWQSVLSSQFCEPLERYLKGGPAVGGFGAIYRATPRDDYRCYGWRSAACMPLWAARFKWCVGRVWVERAQDVSEADAMATGIESVSPCGGCGENRWRNCVGCLHPWNDNPRIAHRHQWNRDWPKAPWESNPWVWCAELEPVATQQE